MESFSNDWKNFDNHKLYANFLKNVLNYKTYEDWYSITFKDFYNNKGSGIITIYNNSPYIFLKTVFPDFNWLPWKFNQCPRNIVNDIKNHKWVLDTLIIELNFKDIDCLHSLNGKDIQRYGGSGMLSKYKNSYYTMLKTVYPNHVWLPWKLNTIPCNLFKDSKIEKEYIEWLKEQLNYKTYEDLYNITTDLILQNYGSSLLLKYGNSIYKMISSILTEYKWKPWLFTVSYHGIWNDKNMVKWFLSDLAELEGYTCMNDWYNISIKILTKHNGGGLLSRFNVSPCLILEYAFPDYNWDKKLFNKVGYSSISLEWISYISNILEQTIQTKVSSQGEKTLAINDKKYKCDGYIDNIDISILKQKMSTISKFSNIYINELSTSLVFEFYGDYWHGNINVQKNNKYVYPKNKKHPIINKTYQELYDNTINRENAIKDKYNLITIWENDWNDYIRNNK